MNEAGTQAHDPIFGYMTAPPQDVFIQYIIHQMSAVLLTAAVEKS